MSTPHWNLLSCPDCGGVIDEIRAAGVTLGLECVRCGVVFAAKDDIPILLPKGARNYDLEFPLIQSIETALLGSSGEAGHHTPASIRHTLELLDSLKGRKSWEWEDEEYWSRVYEADAAASKPREWGVRIWQMEWMIDQIRKRISLPGKTLVDVGCGEGQIFRELLAQHCDESSLYIGCDISIGALKLNRARNPHRKALYVLCSADRLPLQDGVVDLLCYFGILHHAERKDATIREDSAVLADGGLVIVQEAIERPYLSSLLPFLRPSEESAHEERVKKDALLATIRSTTNLEIVASREYYSIVFGLIRFVNGIKWLHNRRSYHFFLRLDLTFLKAFGWMSHAFGPGEIMLLLRKHSAAS